MNEDKPIGVCFECGFSLVTCQCGTLKPDQQPNDVEAVKPIGYASDPLILPSPHEDCGDIAVLNDESYRGNLYSQQTVTQLQEKNAELTRKGESLCQNLGVEMADHQQLQKKITDTEAKLKVAVELLNDVNEYESKVTYSEANACLEEHGVFHRIKDFLDTIRKEQGDANRTS